MRLSKPIKHLIWIGVMGNMINIKKKFDPRSLIIYALLASYFILSPFYVGAANTHEFILEPNLHLSFLFAGILFISLAVWLFKRSDILTRFDIMPFLIWLMPLCFIISWINAVAVQDAIHSIQIQIFNTVIFLVGYFLCSSKEGPKPFVFLIMLSGYILIFITMSDWLGTRIVTDSVVYSIGDYRIFSALYYPNAYAALMIAFFFVCCYLAVASQRRFVMVFSAFLSIPALLSLILTYSRGGYVVFVLLYILFLFMMPIVRQLLFLVFSILCVALTGFLYPFISRIGIEQQSQFSLGSYTLGWLLLLAGSSLLALLTVFVIPRLQTILNKKLLQRSSIRLFLRYIIPVSCIIMIVLGIIALNNDSILKLLPEQLQTRLENLNFRQHSVLERITFYKDAFKIIEDYPLIGAGGGAWNALYMEYQNNPYVTKKPHSFFIGQAVETGILGLCILLIILFFVYYRFIRSQRSDKDHSLRFVFFMFATSILIHSLIDFDMEFMYISGLVYLSMGIMASQQAEESSAKSTQTTKVNPKRIRHISSLLRVSYLCTLGFVAIILIIISSRSLYAYRLYNETMDQLNSGSKAELTISQAVQNLGNIINMKPYHPYYMTEMVAFLHALYQRDHDPEYLQYARYYLDQLKKVSSNFLLAPDAELEHYQIQNDLVHLADTYLYWIDKFPWRVSLYESAVPLLYDLGVRQQYTEETSTRWNEALILYYRMRELMDRIDSLPEEQLPGKDFYISDNIVSTVITILFAQQNDDQVISVIQHHYEPVNVNSPVHILRLYLASQMRLNILDSSLYHEFISRYPEEADMINSLLNSN